MKLAGRINAAIEVLTDVQDRHRPVGLALKDWGNSHRFAGSGDRAAIGNLVYDALRKRASHAHTMGTDAARALVFAVVVREWGETAEALNALFVDDKFAPAALSADEIQLLGAESPLEGAPDAVLADAPAWLVPSLKAGLGENWIDECQGLTDRPPLDLRVNSLKADREKVLKSLKRFAPGQTEIAPLGVRMAAIVRDGRTPNVQTDEAYLKGWCEVQDQGSQIVAALVCAKPGEQVLDYCAGAGGKTLALSAAMENRGQIFAYDSDRSRLAPIYDRLKRNGARNVQVRAPEAGALDDLVGKMDRVVVDAPCTGTGVWRRRPDTKWKLSQDQLDLRVAQQTTVLAEASQFVRPGGTLVYITCSVLGDENEGQIAAFLLANSNYAPCSPTDVWEQALPQPLRAIPSGLGLTLTPRQTVSDGFFISVMSRAT